MPGDDLTDFWELPPDSIAFLLFFVTDLYFGLSKNLLADGDFFCPLLLSLFYVVLFI